MTDEWGDLLAQFNQIINNSSIDNREFSVEYFENLFKDIQQDSATSQDFIQETFNLWKNYNQLSQKQLDSTSLLNNQQILLNNIGFALPISIGFFDAIAFSFHFIHHGLGTQIRFAQDYSDKLNITTLTSNVHPDDQSKIYNLIEKTQMPNLQVGDQLPSIDCRVKTENNTWTWLRVFSTIFSVQENNKPKEFLFIVQDLRAKKNLELALSKSEERYQKFFANIPLSVVVVDIENSLKILEFNQGWVNLTKYPEEALKQKGILDFSPKYQGSGQASSERLQQIVNRYQRRLENITFDWQFQLQNQRILDCEITLFPTSFGESTVHTMLIRNISVQKKFERSLVKSEEKYRKIFDNVYEGILIFNENRDLTSSNKAGYKILEVKPGEKLHFPDLLHPEDRLKADEYFQQLQKQGFFAGYQGKITTPTKQVKFIEVSGTIIYDSNGKFVGSWEIIRDITQQKKNEIALKESEVRYQQLFENAFDGILIYDADARIFLDCNSKLLDIYEATDKNIFLKNTPLDFAPEYQTDGTLSEVALVYHQTKTVELREYEYEWEILLDNGTVKFVKIFASFQNINGTKLFIYIFEEITERKKNEQERQRLYHVQQAIVDAIPAPFFLRGLNGNIITANAKAKEYWGIKGSEIDTIDQPISLIDYDSYFQKKDWEVMEKGFPMLNQIESFEHQTQTYWMRSNRIPFIDEAGKIAGVLVYSNDITDLKEAQQTVELQNQDLLQTNEELDSLVYRAAHDLRSPIASVQGLLNIAKLEKDQSVIESYLDMAHNNLSKLDSFIQDIVDYAKNKRSEIKPESIDFKNLIEESIQQHNYIEQADKIKTTIEVEENQEFYTDFHRIQVVFNNMISNAFKYADHQSKDTSFLNVRVSFDGNNAHITFEDNGIGISEEHVEHIFEMFYRASFKSKSSGIGLYITMESIKKLKGNIEVTSKIGEGTTFKLTLPDLRFTQD